MRRSVGSRRSIQKVDDRNLSYIAQRTECEVGGMNFFKKLFAKKPRAKSQSSPPPDRITAADPSAQKDMIRVYDEYGREVLITKQSWRDNVLLGNLEKVKNDPDKLYDMITGALDDGFAKDVVKYAEHLQRIDPIPSRGAVLLGVVYLELERLKDAEHTFRDYIQRHGEDGYILSNLAKVLSRRGDDATANATLWQALELDPNQENAVGWYWSIERECSGDEAGLEALRKISQLPGSWRAQLWLARTALENKQLDQALKYYDEAIRAAPRPVPAPVLGQMSGDLGNHGHLIELLKLTQPHFDVVTHGLQVGNNLIKANVDLGDWITLARFSMSFTR